MRCIPALVAGIFLFLACEAHASHAININTADKATLMTLSGIGEVKAQAIIDYRATNQFDTIEEVMDVSGIGTATFNSVKDHITVSSGSSQPPQTQGTGAAQTQTQSTSTSNPTPVQSTVSSYVPPPEPSIYLDAGADRVVIVGADTEFAASAYNKKQEPVHTIRFNWNFGDGTVKEGRRTLHHYPYPGRYVVVLSASKDMESVSDRLVVTAEPAKLSFGAGADGSAIIGNDAGRDLDLSQWIVRAAYREFVLPDNSIVLAGASMRIAPQTLGFFLADGAELAYPNGVLALKAGQAFAQSAAPRASEPPPQPALRPEPRVSVEVSAAHAEEAVVPDAETPAAASSSAAQSAAAASSSTPYWLLGALALGAATAASAVLVRRAKAKEWDIVEDSS